MHGCVCVCLSFALRLIDAGEEKAEKDINRRTQMCCHCLIIYASTCGELKSTHTPWWLRATICAMMNSVWFSYSAFCRSKTVKHVCIETEKQWSFIYSKNAAYTKEVGLLPNLH